MTALLPPLSSTLTHGRNGTFCVMFSLHVKEWWIRKERTNLSVVTVKRGLRTPPRVHFCRGTMVASPRGSTCLLPASLVPACPSSRCAARTHVPPAEERASPVPRAAAPWAAGRGCGQAWGGGTRAPRALTARLEGWEQAWELR